MLSEIIFNRLAQETNITKYQQVRRAEIFNLYP
jgi:hypothetical protein